MPHSNALIGQARIIETRASLAGAPRRGADAAQERFYVEDGWVFREHHGKYVECICRSEEIVPAAAPSKVIIPLV